MNVEPLLQAKDTKFMVNNTINSTKRIKVLLYGNIFNSVCRSQILIKFLLDSKYHISLVSPIFYSSQKMKQSYLFQKVFIGFQLLELFIKAAFADVIYMLPFNMNLIKNAIWVSKFFKKKLVVENYVSMYDTFVADRKIYKEGSKGAKKAMHKDILALTKPDYIINTSNHEPAYWAKNLGINMDKNKIFVAPIFSNFDINSMAIFKENYIQNRILRICWWGTFIPLHGLDNVLQTMKLLKEKEVQFTCNLFGVDNHLFDLYVEKIKLDKLDSHVFLRKDLKFFDGSLPHYLAENCDLALGIFGNTDKAQHAVPNKLIEALSIGIPTLTMNSPALAEFFDPETELWTCEPSPVLIAEMIMKIISGTAPSVDWDKTRQKVLSTFSITQYQTVVSKVLGKITDDLYEEKKYFNYSTVKHQK